MTDISVLEQSFNESLNINEIQDPIVLPSYEFKNGDYPTYKNVLSGIRFKNAQNKKCNDTNGILCEIRNIDCLRIDFIKL